MEMDAKSKGDMISTMKQVARDFVGDGYIPSYYLGIAADFASIAEFYVLQKQDRITELEAALADAMGWNWHDDCMPPEVIKRCQKVLNDE